MYGSTNFSVCHWLLYEKQSKTQRNKRHAMSDDKREQINEKQSKTQRNKRHAMSDDEREQLNEKRNEKNRLKRVCLEEIRQKDNQTRNKPINMDANNYEVNYNNFTI